MRDSRHPQPQRPAHAHGLLERGAAIADQKVAHMGVPGALPTVLCVAGCVAFCPAFARRSRNAAKLDRLARHIGLGARRQPGNRLDRMAVAVTGGEIHLRISAAGIVPQDLLYAAEHLDELAPVDGAQQAQAADAVAHRHLARRLLLAFQLHQLFNRLVRFSQALLHPCQRQREACASPLQAPGELGHESAGQRRRRACHVGDDQDQFAGRFFCHIQHALSPDAGRLSPVIVHGHARGDAAKVLDQRQSQHDRAGPQLAQQQRLNRLVGRDEAAQRAAAYLPVAMRHGLQGEGINAWLAGGLAVGRIQREPRQFKAVAAGQVAARGADFFLDEVEVVEQPFCCWREAALGVGSRGKAFAQVDQNPLVGSQSVEQLVGQPGIRHHMRRRQPLAILGHLVGAEEFSAQRFIFGLRSDLGRSGTQSLPPGPDVPGPES